MNYWRVSSSGMKNCQGPDDGYFPRQLSPRDEFYRAIHPDYMKANGRISSGAFSKAAGSDRMSVDWSERSTPDQTYHRWKHWGQGRGVALITAQLCWENQQLVLFTPTADNSAHSDVVNKAGYSIGKDRLRKNLARGARLIVGD